MPVLKLVAVEIKSAIVRAAIAVRDEVLITRAARRPHPEFSRILIAEIDAWRRDTTAHAVEVEGLTNLASSKRSAPQHHRVAVAFEIVRVVLGCVLRSVPLHN